MKAYANANNKTDHDWECAEYVAAVLDIDVQATPAAVVNYMLDNGSVLIAIQKG